MGEKDTFLSFLGSSDGVNFKILYRYFVTKLCISLLFYLEDGTYFHICGEKQIRPKVFVSICTIHFVPYCILSCHTSCKQWHP